MALTTDIWLHGHSDCSVWEQAQRVTCCALSLERVALEVNTMHVYLCAKSHEMPSYPGVLLHLKARQVPIHKAIHSCITQTK